MLYDISFDDFNSKIGMTLCRSYRNKNFPKLVIEAILNYANSIGLKKVYGEVYSNNMASIKMVNKNKFFLEGCLKKHKFLDNGFVDIYIYSKFINFV